jgi:ketosteroid isomerase-like protein
MWQVLPASVRLAGDAAVVTAAVTDDAERDGQRLTFKMPMTQTWVKTVDGWQLLAGHAGPRLPGP